MQSARGGAFVATAAGSYGGAAAAVAIAESSSRLRARHGPNYMSGPQSSNGGGKDNGDGAF